jgi:hypothetical protein
VSVPAVHEYGLYTLYDLDALPEDGKRYELADGWLTELSSSPWHDPAADRLKDILKNAARLAGAEVYVAGGPNDIATPAGVRKPDVFVVPRDVARTAINGKVRAFRSMCLASTTRPTWRAPMAARSARPVSRAIASSSGTSQS